LVLNAPTGPNVPESLHKAFSALDALLTHCSVFIPPSFYANFPLPFPKQTISQHSESLYISLSESTKRVADVAGELQQLAADAGLKGQKAT
jgi:hypothetical protein